MISKLWQEGITFSSVFLNHSLFPVCWRMDQITASLLCMLLAVCVLDNETGLLNNPMAAATIFWLKTSLILSFNWVLCLCLWMSGKKQNLVVNCKMCCYLQRSPMCCFIHAADILYLSQGRWIMRWKGQWNWHNQKRARWGGEASGVHTQAALLVLSLAPVHVVTMRQVCFLPSHLCTWKIHHADPPLPHSYYRSLFTPILQLSFSRHHRLIKWLSNRNTLYKTCNSSPINSQPFFSVFAFVVLPAVCA